MTDTERVREYYRLKARAEWERLTRPNDGALEFAMNKRHILRFLPPQKPLRILDIGGGPGRYALWLAEQGHRVILADLSEALIGVARQRIVELDASGNIEEMVVADVQDLSRWGNSEFDAVLCLGPFYHLMGNDERAKAAAEVRRVLKPGGTAFIAAMSHLTFLYRVIGVNDETILLLDEDVRQDLLDGKFEGSYEGRFAQGYGFHPEDIPPFFAEHHFECITLLHSEGIGMPVQQRIFELKEQALDLYETVLDLVARTADDPSILGLPGHLLYVGRAVE